HTAKIVDFGLAIFMEQEESVRGEIWGTPYYVAPEKLDGKAEDFRSDIYSLGASLFHAMAGRPPFEAESASLVALKHLKAQPVSLQAFAPHISGRTAFIINRTLLKDPDARYQSYDELIGHLEYAREELLQAAGKAPQSKRVVLESEQDQKAWGWVTLGMLVLIVVGAIVLFSFRGQIFGESDSGGAVAAQEKRAPAAAASASEAAMQKARAKLLEGRAAEAADDFRAIGSTAKLPASELAWATLQEGIAELQAGHMPAAQTAFKSLGEQGEALARQEGELKELGAFLVETAARMGTADPLKPELFKEIRKTGFEGIALLAGGLKNWQLGSVEEAATLFRQFRSVTPSGDEAWIAQLKPLASQYIEELTRFQMLTGQFKAASSTLQKFDISRELSSFKGPLQVRAARVLEPIAGELAAYEKNRTLLPADGAYHIVNRQTGTALDVFKEETGNMVPVKLWEARRQGNQKWNIKAVENGYYRLLVEHSGKALDVAHQSQDDSAAICQHDSNDSSAQRWFIESVGDGYFKLTAQCSGKVLTVNSKNRTDLHQSTYNGAKEQQWSFVPYPNAVK
ncbi:MAG: RICIN domain-containing protein, partial [Verrucomicrobiota bacterium]